MKILITISDLNIGGAQTFAIRLAQALSDDHKVYIYNCDLSGSPEQETVVDQIPANIKIITFPKLLGWLSSKIGGILAKFGIRYKLWLATKRLHFKSIILFYRIDVINSHLFHSDQFVTSVMQNSSTPIVITDHGDYRFVIKNQMADLGEVARIIKRANGIVFPSQSNSEIFLAYNFPLKSESRIIYYGFTLNFAPSLNNLKFCREELKITDRAFIFGMVARGISEKGWSELVNAFKLLQDLTQKEVHLLLVGGGDYLRSLEESLDNRVRDFIHFVGHSSNPNFWIQGFDVGVLPTYFPGESLPNSIIEYLSLGKPVIATNVGGITEMIDYQGQKCGTLIDLNDQGKPDQEMLAQAMLKYVEDPVLLKSQANLALKAAEKFKMEICVNYYQKFFQEIILSAKN